MRKKFKTPLTAFQALIDLIAARSSMHVGAFIILSNVNFPTTATQGEVIECSFIEKPFSISVKYSDHCLIWSATNNH